MNHLLTQGPGEALEILTRLNKIVDGENSKTEEEMDTAGELACASIVTILDEISKEEAFILLSSMSTVQNISEFIFDEIFDYIKKNYGTSDLLKELER